MRIHWISIQDGDSFPIEIVNRTKIKTHHYNYTLVEVCYPGWSSLLPQRLYQRHQWCCTVSTVSTVIMQHNTQHSADVQSMEELHTMTMYSMETFYDAYTL